MKLLSYSVRASKAGSPSTAWVYVLQGLECLGIRVQGLGFRD